MSKNKPPHPRAPKTKAAPEKWSKDPWRKPKQARPQWAEAMWDEGPQQRRGSLGSGQTLDLDMDGLPIREHVTQDDPPPSTPAPSRPSTRQPAKDPNKSTLEMDQRAIAQRSNAPGRRPLHDPDAPVHPRSGPGLPDVERMRHMDTGPQGAIPVGGRPSAPSGAETLRHFEVHEAAAGEATQFFTAADQAAPDEDTHFYKTLSPGQDQVDTAPSIPPVQDPHGAVVLVFRPHGPTQAVILREDVPHLIGRKQGCEIEVVEQAVSREHATLTWRGNGFELRDLGGRNGTLVNGIRVQHVSLEPGDQIRIGEHTLRLIRGPYTAEDLHDLPAHPQRLPGEFKRDPERGFFKRLMGFVGKK